MNTNPLSRGLLAASLVAAIAGCTDRGAQAPQAHTENSPSGMPRRAAVR